MSEIRWDTSPDGILNLISTGEGEHVDFKVRLPPDDSLARTITAFANTRGGVLLIGVGPGGDIKGLVPEEASVAAHRLDRIGKSFSGLPYRAGTVDIDGKIVAYMAIGQPPPEFLPLGTAEGRFFKRAASRDIDLDVLDSTWRAWLSEMEPLLVKPDHTLVAFVAMSFRTEEEPHLVDYYHAMKRAAERVGGVATNRIDLVEGDYEISQKIMDEIDKADVVISDFTLSPRNVYFELGFARGRGKHVIQTAPQGTALEFDIRNWRTLFYRNATELEEALVGAFKVLKSAPRGQSS